MPLAPPKVLGKSLWCRVFPRLDVFVIQSLWMPWIFGFGAFTVIGFSVGSLFDILRRLTQGELSGITAVQVLVLQLPRFIVLALPMSLLLAPLLAYGQLAHSNELTALRACGVSVYRMVRPAICFSLVVAVCTLAINELVVPPTTLKANTLLAQYPQDAIALISKKNIVHKTLVDQQRTQLFYAQTFDGYALHQLTILQYQDQTLHQIWLAKQATWDKAKKQWILFEGTCYTINPESGLYQQVKAFQQQPLHAASLNELAQASRQPISITEIRYLLNQLPQVSDVLYQRKLQVRLHTLMSFPWIGVGFSMIGAALGCRAHQKRASLGFGFSSILIFAHYLFSFICQTLGDVGILAASLSGWLPLCSLFTIGAFLLKQANTKSASP